VQELMSIGERGYLASEAPRLGELCLRRGDPDEARRWMELSRDIAPADDNDAQARWRALAARLAARQRRIEDALRLADEAVDYESKSDGLVTHAERYVDRAEVLHRAGRSEDAVADLHSALECFQRKGHKPGTRAVRARLAAVAGPADP
jgi:tetratricopeptide (TPR) repeat protein